MIGRRSHDDAQAFDDAWNGAVPRDEHIAGLVGLADGLREAAVVEPTRQFRTDLRAHLMAEAATALVPRPGAARPAAAPSPVTSTGRRRLAGLTAALVASAGGVSLVASSASAVPGEMLYPIKRTVESVELNLHRDDASRGSFHLAQATERLTEARNLSDKGARDALVADTLDDFSSAALDGSSLLFGDFTDNGNEASVRKVNRFAAAASAALTRLEGVLPDDAGDSFVAASQTVTDLAAEAASLCPSCGSADVQALAKAATGHSSTQPAAKRPAKNDREAVKKSAAAPRPAAPAPSADKPAPAPAPTRPPSTTPAPTTPTRAPSLADITDPLLGGLLGSDTQEGLVPGLLKGLLGGGR